MINIRTNSGDRRNGHERQNIKVYLSSGDTPPLIGYMKKQWIIWLVYPAVRLEINDDKLEVFNKTQPWF